TMTLPGAAERAASAGTAERAGSAGTAERAGSAGTAEPTLVIPRSRAILPIFGVVTFAAGLTVGVVAMRLAQPPSRPLSTRSLMVATPLLAPTQMAAPPAPPPEPAPARPNHDEVELSITTIPAGADVAIDGEAAGVSPMTTRISRGKHEVTVSKERYAS